MIPPIFPVLVYFAFVGFAAMRIKRYLIYFQQDEYDGPRFFRWLISNRLFDKILSAILLALSLGLYLPLDYANLLMQSSTALAFTYFGFSDYRALGAAKKKLNMTKRANAIYRLAVVLIAVLAIALAIWSDLPVVWIIAVQAIPLMLIAATTLLKPMEARVQAGYRADAVKLLSEINPRIIGITGSFGKTSVKHILGHILQLGSESVYTPGSVNTVMGIVRVIREKLLKTTKNFVVEMGAYGRGSIQRVCDLTPPDFGIITSIGAAHYERFKSLDAVAHAKFELADNTRKRGGTVVVDETVLAQPYAAKYVEEHRSSFRIVGEGSGCDLQILRTDLTEKGIEIELRSEAGKVAFSAPLYGIVHGRNIALAVAMARILGVPDETIRIALQSVPQISHRLEVNRQANGVTVIDDAYNSNPVGFRAALTVLDRIGGKQGRKIVVTPGQVEMGGLHDSIHKELGAETAQIADLVIVVAPQRIPTFVDAIKLAGTELIERPSFFDAKRWIEDNFKPGDTVLLENDLPDVYEQLPRF